MKKILRLLPYILIFTFLAGATTSCSLFEEPTATKTKSYKIKKPLPKKWVVHNKSTRNLK